MNFFHYHDPATGWHTSMMYRMHLFDGGMHVHAQSTSGRVYIGQI